MKQNNGARIILIRGLLLVILSLYFMVVFSQSPELVSFNASKKEENIALQWVLAPANKLSTIIIERKTTDTSFRSIAEFWVNFDGNTERNFKYTDKKVKSKTAQYRLKCIAADGKVQYSDVVLAGDGSVQKNSTKPSAIKNKNISADTASSTKNVDHLKGLLLVQLTEREKNLL